MFVLDRSLPPLSFLSVHRSFSSFLLSLVFSLLSRPLLVCSSDLLSLCSSSLSSSVLLPLSYTPLMLGIQHSRSLQTSSDDTLNNVCADQVSPVPCHRRGRFSCKRPCGRPLTCGNHNCSRECHLVTDGDKVTTSLGC